LQRIRRAPLRKGLSELLGGLIMITILLALVIPFMLYVISSRQAQEQTYLMAKAAEERKKLERIVFKLASATDTEKVYQIWNNGSVPSQIRYLIVREIQQNGNTVTKVLDTLKLVGQDIDGYSIELKDGSQVIANSYIEIQPQGYIELRTPSNAYLVTLSTSLGQIAESVTGSGGEVTRGASDGTARYSEVAGSVAIETTEFTSPETPASTAEEVLTSLQDINISREQLVIPLNPIDAGKGMKRLVLGKDNAVLILKFNSSNVYIITSSNSTSESEHLNFLSASPAQLRVSSAIIGYDPYWTAVKTGEPTFNILLMGTDVDTDSYIYLISLNQSKAYRIDLTAGRVSECELINNYSVGACNTLIKSFTPDYGWRVKIIGFKPTPTLNLTIEYDYEGDGVYNIQTLSNSSALGAWWLFGYTKYNDDPINIIKITLKGEAKEIRLYATEVGFPETSYEPYLIVADIDGNFMPEIVFDDIDQGFGYSTSCDDAIPLIYEISGIFSSSKLLLSGGYCILDYSSTAFWLNLTGNRYLLNGKRYAAVELNTRIYFIDNSLDTNTQTGLFGVILDIISGASKSDITDKSKVILGIYLVNMNTGQIVSSREFTYEDFDQFEYTFPPSRNFITISVVMPLPNDEGPYYIAIKIQDPYSISTTSDYTDDLDFIIGVEWLGVTLYTRS